MTIMSWMMTFFPVLHVGLILGSIYRFCLGADLKSFGMVFASVYLLPLISFRIHNFFFPLKCETTDLGKKAYSPWWGGHQIQVLFAAIPALESVLKILPGLFSLWLRLWGSQIGSKVYWTPLVSIEDRSLMRVGDGVIFGNKVECYGHVITQKGGSLRLFVDTIEIGSGSFIGAGVRMAPGVRIAAKTTVPLLKDLYPREIFG